MKNNKVKSNKSLIIIILIVILCAAFAGIYTFILPIFKSFSVFGKTFDKIERNGEQIEKVFQDRMGNLENIVENGKNQANNDSKMDFQGLLNSAKENVQNQIDEFERDSFNFLRKLCRHKKMAC